MELSTCYPEQEKNSTEKMITAIAEKLTNKLLSNGYLAAAEKEEIAYGLFTFFSRCFFLLICIFFGVLFRCFFESVAYYFTFLFVKKYAGGYHASTELRCIILSSTSIFLSVLCIYICKSASTLYLIPCLVSIIAGCIICLFAPVEVKEKQLTAEEKKRFRLYSIIRVILVLFIVSICYYFSEFDICVAISIGVIMEGILISLGRKKLHSEEM